MSLPARPPSASKEDILFEEMRGILAVVEARGFSPHAFLFVMNEIARTRSLDELFRFCAERSQTSWSGPGSADMRH